MRKYMIIYLEGYGEWPGELPQCQIFDEDQLTDNLGFTEAIRDSILSIEYGMSKCILDITSMITVVCVYDDESEYDG